jgi:hypothetical protein
MFLASFGVLVFCRSLKEKWHFSCVIAEKRGEDKNQTAQVARATFMSIERQTARAHAPHTAGKVPMHCTGETMTNAQVRSSAT